MSDKTKLGVVIAFLAGLALGWFVFGWMLFPVHWTNVDPWELRATAKAHYLDFVAEDYAAHHDMNRVRNFLMGWPDEDLSKFLPELIVYHQKKGETELTKDVAELSRALGPEVLSPRQPKKKGILPLVFEILALLLILAGILYAVWRYFLHKAEYGGESAAEAVASAELPEFRPSPPSGPGVDVATLEAKEEEKPLESGELLPEAHGESEEAEHAIAPEEAVPEAEPEERKVEEAPAAAPFPPLPGQWELLKRSVLEFKFGEDPNYTDSQDLMVNGEYIGNCGLGPEEWMDDDQEQPWIFTVWLFDKQDINTQQAMILSPAAWADEAIKSRLMDEKEGIKLVEAVPGRTFMLETKGLRLDGEVESVKFSDAADGRSVITHLKVRADIYQNPEAGVPDFLNS